MIGIWPTGQILHHAHTHHTQTHAHIHTTSFHSPTYFGFKDSAGCLPFIFIRSGFRTFFENFIPKYKGCRFSTAFFHL